MIDCVGVVQLYRPAVSHPDASREVRAPGGYECWSFYAVDERAGRRMIVELRLGSPTDARYLREYRRYRRNPTSHAPPLPADYPSVSIQVFDAERSFSLRRVVRYRASDVAMPAGGEHGRIAIGPNGFAFDDHSQQLELSLDLPAETGAGPRISGRIQFEAIFYRGDAAGAGAAESDGEEASPARHFWIPARPSCRTSGSLCASQGGSDGARAMRLDGIGAQGYRFGLEPPALSSRLRVGGIVLNDNRAITFQIRVPRTSSTATRYIASVLDTSIANAAVTHVPEVAAILRLSARRSLFAPRHPSSIVLPTSSDPSGNLSLDHPHVIGRDAIGTTTLYDASARDGRAVGKALCTSIDFDRFGWEMLGRLAERDAVDLSR